jgi:tetratricopeptide (TPR) repeat protein
MMRSDTTRVAMLVVAVLLAYFNALGAAFQFDDYNVIVNNSAVHSLDAWSQSMPGIRPLLKFSYALNWTLNAAPFGFHLFNIIVHAVNTVLVYRLLGALRAPAGGVAQWAPFVGALLFALHPVQTEAVTYVSGRSVSLMALFYLGSVLAWLRANDAKDGTPWRVLSAALFAAALLVKEMAVALPLTLLLLDAVSRQRMEIFRTASRLRWHALVLAIGLCAFFTSPTYRSFLDISLSTRGIADNLLTQINAMGYLAAQLVLPWRMNIDPDLPVVKGMSMSLLFGMVVIGAIVWIGWRNRRERPWLAFAILWFFLHLLPTNSIIARLDVANDRQLYLAAIGPFFAIGIAVEALARGSARRWAWAATALVLLALAVATVQRNQDYASAVALWEDTLKKSPRKARVANNLGYAFQEAGRIEEAKLAYRQAIELDPDYWRARINLEALESAKP